MNIDLTDTTTRRIQEAIGQARHQTGGPAVGMVLTLVRVTDSYAAVDRLGTLAQLGHAFRPGDTDFAWTRLTAWRTLLAAALDQKTAPVISGEVLAEPDSPSAELLAAWLSVRLGVAVRR